jgi:dTDP-4-amino-4,6-dideoxygalactose transaminase
MKENIDDLAIFGGAPAFQEMLHVGRPNLGNRERLFERINDMLDRKWLSNNGLYVQEFERRIADMIGVKNCIVMCNGTIALEIAIRALELKGEVILPSFTFVATAHALQWQEITPVFCDIDPRTHTIDPFCIEKMITPRTTGIIGVHLWGRPCDIESLEEIAASHHLKLLFDAAHGFGCSYKGRMLGSFGNAEVFSFHPTKLFNSCEGGAIVTDDDALAAKIRLMKNFGFSGYDNVIYIGTNGKMNEFSALMGLTNLESLDEFIAVTRCNYEYYKQEIGELAGVTLIDYDQKEKCNYQYVVLEIDESVTHVSRDHIIDILRAENVLARRYFYPGCHRMEPYRSYFPHAGLVLPETERLAKRVLSLPTGTAVGQDEIRNICQMIRLAVEYGPEVKERLSGRVAVTPQYDMMISKYRTSKFPVQSGETGPILPAKGSEAPFSERRPRKSMFLEWSQLH